MIPAPPSEGGALQRTVASRSEVEWVGFVGVDGDVVGIAVTADDQELTAELDIALILKE